ncbi:MAG: dicarboxylate/amino acid:cation symporter [Acidobacteriota bacterium]|nr:dicarboxylate/amino acid:cation symporter [Acidobacteriota bacterium]
MKLALHWKILLGMVLGLVYGVIAASTGLGWITSDWIAPFGKIFVNLLKLIAIPLVLGSLITGVASLSDLKKLSRIGGKTITIYIATTAVAVTIGLLVVNIMQPGKSLPQDMRTKLQSTYESSVADKEEAAGAARERGPLQPLVDMVPSNFFSSAGNNRNMLQVVFFAIFVGIALVQVGDKKRTASFLGFFEGLNDVVIKMVDTIMLFAPIGVFALIADTINAIAADDLSSVWELLGGLGFYCIAVVVGLLLQMTLVYTTVLKIFTPLKLGDFLRALGPVQLLAFSTSSSGATLPVTMERCEQNLGVSEEVSSFVLPLGATINMDGTALYQAIAAVFIAQALGLSLGVGDQLTIILTAVLASIGTAAVPGAGIIMLVVILEAISVPSAGIALILGVDRILDMCRTVTNVTGDASVAASVAATENQLGTPSFDN